MTTRFVKPPFTRLVVVGAVYQVIAYIVYVLSGTVAFTPVGAFAAVTATSAVGLVLHLLLLLVNIFVRADFAHDSEDARYAFSFDQWYAMVGLVSSLIVLVTVAGLWIAGTSVTLAGIIGLALMTGPALAVLNFVLPLPREGGITIEEGRNLVDSLRNGPRSDTPINARGTNTWTQINNGKR